MRRSRLKPILLVLAFLASAQPLLAHPGVGIVMDARGRVFYTDLRQVWVVNPDGSKRIVVPSVHTHELCLDEAGNLYGEHVWYEGDATKKWGHRVWRLTPDGALSDVIPARQGFLDDYDDFHFARDRRGNMYWAVRAETTEIRKRTPDGAVTTVAAARFRDVRWLTASPDGTVYLIDLYDLVRITPDGIVKTVARDLADRNWAHLFMLGRHAMMGLWPDGEGNVYVANLSGRAVKKVGPDGHVEVVARSDYPWSPTGGLIAPNGDLWLLESGLGSARVRRIGKDGTSTTFD